MLRAIFVSSVTATAPPTVESGFHALARARAPWPFYPRSLLLFRQHVADTAATGACPRLLRRRTDHPRSARKPGSHYGSDSGGRPRSQPLPGLERRGVFG